MGIALVLKAGKDTVFPAWPPLIDRNQYEVLSTAIPMASTTSGPLRSLPFRRVLRRW